MKNKRNPYFDNIKFILILLVVIGHTIEPFIHKHRLIYATYKVIYTFHMPLFILISGYFAKKAIRNRNYTKLIHNYLVPYLIFQILYSVMYFGVENKATYTLRLFTPYFTLWFLLTVFTCHLILPWLLKLPAPMVWALLAGAAIGYINLDGKFLSLSRTFVFLPFFLAGYRAEERHFTFFQTRKRKLAAPFILLSLFICFYWVFPDFTSKWLTGSYSYQELGVAEWHGGVYRLLLYIVQTLAIVSILALVPRRETFYTPRGSRTLYVYLFHGLIIRSLDRMGFFHSIQSPMELLSLLPASIALTFLLSTETVERLTRPWLFPNLSLPFFQEKDKSLSDNG